MSLSTFNEVEDRTLRAWNRFAVYFNTASNVSQEAALKYIGQFNNSDKKDLQKMYQDMRNLGYDTVKASVMRGSYSV